MSIEEELRKLALEREKAIESALDELDLDPPDVLLRQMRAYLADREDRGRIQRFAEKSVHLSQLEDGIDELACDAVRFASESILDFNIRMKKLQTGWLITQFKFHLHLPRGRKVSMVRVHLNEARTRDALVYSAMPPAHRRRQKGPCTVSDHEPDLAACL